MSTNAAPGHRPVWVGLLDLDGDGPVVGMNGPLRADHHSARLLVRMHGAPVGLVAVPAVPDETLTARARAAAEATLAAALRDHAEHEAEAEGTDAPQGWATRVTCPRYFPVPTGEGITVLVGTRDRPKLLADCLHSLRQLAYEPLELLIVDNAPASDETRRLVAAVTEQDARVRYTCEPRPGRSAALNHGLARARFELVAITDDDTLADPGWLRAVAAGFAADSETVCATGPVMSCALESGSERYFDARYPWGERFAARRYDLAENRHPSRFYPFAAGVFGTGANCAVRRSVIAGIGGFDTLLGAGTPRRGGADLDLFVRIILAGGRICYLPSALVWHRHRADTKALAEQLYAYGHGLGAYLAKHLANRDLRDALIAHGMEQAGVLLGRQRLASRSSQLGRRAWRLALYEAGGVVPGALGYWQAARRASHSPSGAR